MKKVPLWILDGALCVRESRGEMSISSLGPGDCGVWGRGNKEGGALWQIVMIMAHYYPYIISDYFTAATRYFSLEVARCVICLICTL